jgi:hypothetical protein
VYETSTLILKAQQKMKVFDYGMLMGIFGQKRKKKMGKAN